MMNRRRFIGNTLLPLCLPPSLLAQTASIAGPDMVYYDDRFPRARMAVDGLADMASLVAVRGDVTTVWNSGLRTACKQGDLSLVGVTTESFYFCLQRLLHLQGEHEARITRVDHDLHAWSIRSINNNNRINS